MTDDKVLDTIILFIKATKEQENIKSENETIPSIGNARYLLGQIIRQLRFDGDKYKYHYFVSKNAADKWKQISNKDIFEYYYRMTVYCESKEEIVIHKYKGNGKAFDELQIKSGDKFVYRDVFHDEHMMPVSDIIERLLALDEPNYENVGEILNSIYICKMLKDEDKKLNLKFHRPSDIRQVIEQVYKPAGIEVIGLEEKLNKTAIVKP